MLRMWKKNRILMRDVRMQRTRAEQKIQIEKYKSVCEKIREYLYSACANPTKLHLIH